MKKILWFGLFLIFAGYHSGLSYSQNKKEMTFEQVLEYGVPVHNIFLNTDTAGVLLKAAAIDNNQAPALQVKLNAIETDLVLLAGFMKDHYTNDLPFNTYLGGAMKKLSALCDNLILYSEQKRINDITFLLVDCIGGNYIDCALKLLGP